MKIGATIPLALCTIAAAMPVAAPCEAKSAPGYTTEALPTLSTWTAVAASGPVQARSAAAAEGDAWRAVSRGDELMPRTTVETGRKGRVTLTRHASLVIVDPRSRVELPEQGFGSLQTSVVQSQGSVLYRIDSRANPHFEVVTPYLVAGVKGTSFLVTVNDRYTSVTVQHGRVEITNPTTGEVFMLGGGESVVRQREDVEMDLVRSLRRSPEARKEARRLEKMVRGVNQLDSDTESLISETLDADRGVRWDWNDGRPTGDAVLIDVDDLTRDLIEEMIREGIKDGAIKEPLTPHRQDDILNQSPK
jgi:hypothetical protein